MFTKLQKKISLMSLALIGVLGLGGSALAAPSSTPAEVIDAVVGSGINSTVTLVTTVVSTYFPYLIAFGVIAVIFTWVKRFGHVGAK